MHRVGREKKKNGCKARWVGLACPLARRGFSPMLCICRGGKKANAVYCKGEKEESAASPSGSCGKLFACSKSRKEGGLWAVGGEGDIIRRSPCFVLSLTRGTCASFGGGKKGRKGETGLFLPAEGRKAGRLSLKGATRRLYRLGDGGESSN